jgi:hypothetical protein
VSIAERTTFTPEWIESWRMVVNEAPLLPVIGKTFTCTFVLGFGDNEYVVSVREGRIDRIDAGVNAETRSRFALRAPQAMWERFLEDPPPPMFNDIWAMNWHVAHPEGDLLKIDGDLLAVWQFNRNIDYFLDLLRRA